jgi:hypothetical protein
MFDCFLSVTIHTSTEEENGNYPDGKNLFGSALLHAEKQEGEGLRLPLEKHKETLLNCKYFIISRKQIRRSAGCSC